MKSFIQPWLFASAFSCLLPLGVAAQTTDHTIPAPTFYRTVEVDGLNRDVIADLMRKFLAKHLAGA
jgi:hypothetical protein